MTASKKNERTTANLYVNILREVGKNYGLRNPTNWDFYRNHSISPRGMRIWNPMEPKLTGNATGIDRVVYLINDQFTNHWKNSTNKLKMITRTWNGAGQN